MPDKISRRQETLANVNGVPQYTHKSKHVYKRGECRDDVAVPAPVCLIHKRVDTIGCEQRDSHIGYISERKFVESEKYRVSAR